MKSVVGRLQKSDDNDGILLQQLQYSEALSM